MEAHKQTSSGVTLALRRMDSVGSSECAAWLCKPKSFVVQQSPHAQHKHPMPSACRQNAAFNDQVGTYLISQLNPMYLRCNSWIFQRHFFKGFHQPILALRQQICSSRLIPGFASFQKRCPSKTKEMSPSIMTTTATKHTTTTPLLRVLKFRACHCSHAFFCAKH